LRFFVVSCQGEKVPPQNFSDIPARPLSLEAIFSDLAFNQEGWEGFVNLWPWKDFFVQPVNVFIR
jgi:hypothetical protein